MSVSWVSGVVVIIRVVNSLKFANISIARDVVASGVWAGVDVVIIGVVIVGVVMALTTFVPVSNGDSDCTGILILEARSSGIGASLGTGISILMISDLFLFGVPRIL